MPTGQDLISRAWIMQGKPYIYGYEVDLDNPDPKAADCSELAQWVCHQEGVTPEMPDGAKYQYRHCRNQGTLIDVDDAKNTPGALLFRIGVHGDHVAFSMGDGETTFEARGRDYEIGVQPANGRLWTHGALVPGVYYEGWEV